MSMNINQYLVNELQMCKLEILCYDIRANHSTYNMGLCRNSLDYTFVIKNRSKKPHQNQKYYRPFGSILLGEAVGNFKKEE